MTFPDILYTILISPLQLFFEVLYTMANKIIQNPGMSIIVLSLAMNFLVLPLYRRADAMQDEERDMEAKLHDGVAHIKKTFKGDEKMMILQTFYRQNNYKPTYIFKGSISLFLEIPFFIAAYQFLSHLQVIQGVRFGVISNLGAADALIAIGNYHINLLPILMTAINLVSCVIFTRGYPKKTKVQLYVLAIFFFIFLYGSPAGLVFYWTLNNIFSLVKTIFYKLKNAKKILHIVFAFAGAALIICAVRFLFAVAGCSEKFICVAVFGIAFMLPLIISVIKKYSKIELKPLNIESNRKVYFAGAIFMVVLIGCVIPSSVLQASPQEFVDLYSYVNPLWNICSSLCFSIGTFLVWMGVFYWLTKKKYKAYFEIFVWITCGITTLNYMLFGKNLGILSNALKFENGMHFSHVEKLQNLAVVIGAAILMFVIYRFGRKIAPQVLIVCTLAFSAMSIYNVVRINSQVSVVQASASVKGETPSFTLSKSGKNVIVLMMDRAMNEYIPYLMNEKPELKNEFSGFTYYPNTFSFGGFTNFGTPALFGGYEYTPVEMNKRKTETLKSKQNEALKVMPVLFDQNHYNVTVCDPSYANYQWIPDLSIYNKYPDIHKYITLGKFTDKKIKPQDVNNKRNFFCYSIMKTVPLFMQPVLYNKGDYNSQENPQVAQGQELANNFVADGIDPDFMRAYSVLENLPSMTKIKDDDTNTFLMMTNDTTHDPMLLQEPDYVPAEHVDNTAYETKNANRFTINEKTLKMETGVQYIHYQANMASMLKLGAWMDYLKKNHVYDNTRIIIVADHGRPLEQLSNMVIKNSKDDANIYDAEFYYPLLLVKDFNSNNFTTSEELMTNGDVPTLAVKDLIKNPKNPFTGKEINNNAKYTHDQYILGSTLFDITKNNGKIYLPGTWFTVHNDVRDKKNWTILNVNATSPTQK